MLQERLKQLAGQSVQVLDCPRYAGEGSGSIEIVFSGGAWIECAYWRLIKDEKLILSSFDHLQQYGLPAPIDAVAELQGHLDTKMLRSVEVNALIGDVILHFSEPFILQILRLGGQEEWELGFPDGYSWWSNHV